MVMEVVHEESQCVSHPYKNSTPGGICAFCLQEKLVKLASTSSVSASVLPSSSSSSSPSFRSDVGVGSAAVLRRRDAPSLGSCATRSQRSKLPFVLMRRKKRKEAEAACSEAARFVFMRSKSTVIPGKALHFLDENNAEDHHIHSPSHRRGFLSFFLYTPKDSNVKKRDKQQSSTPATSKKRGEPEMVLVEENGSPEEAKVSRSRSIGCGSRSFSGDFFERISTGFGDCTLRRVESQREGKAKARAVRRNDCNVIKERGRCGGIFSGFMIASSSSSSSTSSYWASSDNNIATGNPEVKHKQLSHGRSRAWGWALGKPCSGKRSNKCSVPPNLASISSL